MILSKDEKYESAVSEFSTEAGADTTSLVIPEPDVAGERSSTKFSEKMLLFHTPFSISWLEKENVLKMFFLLSRSSRLIITSSDFVGLISSDCFVTFTLFPSSNIETEKFVVVVVVLGDVMLSHVWLPRYFTSKTEGSVSDF